jgi:hypothetical protein
MLSHLRNVTAVRVGIDGCNSDKSKIGDEGILSLLRMPRLTSLDLEQNLLSYYAVVDLVKLPKLNLLLCEPLSITLESIRAGKRLPIPQVNSSEESEDED